MTITTTTKLFLQIRLSLHNPFNIGIYKIMPCTLGTSFSSTPLGKKVCTSLCSFNVFLQSLDKGYLFLDFPRFTRFKDDFHFNHLILHF